MRNDIKDGELNKYKTVPVYDSQMGCYMMMEVSRAAYNVAVNPQRFTLEPKKRNKNMSPKNTNSTAPKTLKMDDIKGKAPKGVQKFSAFQSDNHHRKLTDYYDRTIYIVKIEPSSSENYGDGYKLWFKENLKSDETFTASCFGEYVVPALDDLYKLTHNGKQISLDRPIETTIRKAGRTYRFE